MLYRKIIIIITSDFLSIIEGKFTKPDVNTHEEFKMNNTK